MMDNPQTHKTNKKGFWETKTSNQQPDFTE